MSWLSNAGSKIVNNTLGSGIYHTLVPQRPDAPTLPQSPTLQAPQLPQYPGFSPEQQALLRQQQGYLTGSEGVVSGYGSNPYLQQSGQADQQALQNYQNALQGKIAPNQMIEQQKARDWAQTIQQAAQQGIRISGDSPESAVSQSTAGNQLIQDFTKRYGALEQNYNLGQQQIGMQAQGQALGQVNQQYQNQLGGYNNLAGQAQQLFNPYQQQQMGQYQQQTNQAMSNTDIANQNAMNAYQQQLQQIGLNYNNAMGRYQSNMGFLSGALQLGGMAAGGAMGGPMGAMAGGQAGSILGGGGQQSQGFNPSSFIQAYQRPQQPTMNTSMGMNSQYGFNPYTHAYPQNQQQFSTYF